MSYRQDDKYVERGTANLTDTLVINNGARVAANGTLTDNPNVNTWGANDNIVRD